MTTYTKAVPKPTRPKAQRKWKEKAMQVAAKLATIDGKCHMEGCKNVRSDEYEIVAHHVIHRKHGNVCADVDNLFPCCVPCHSRIHHCEREFHEWFDSKYPGLREQLQREAQKKYLKLDFEEIYACRLDQYHESLKAKQKKEGL